MESYTPIYKIVKQEDFLYNGEHKPLNCSHSIHDFIRPIFKDTLEVKEVLYCIALKNLTPVGINKVSEGCINATLCDHRLLFKFALDCLATGIILVHNHPSGRINPSDADKKLCKQLREGCNTLKIDLIDFTIITKKEFLSFRDEGLID